MASNDSQLSIVVKLIDDASAAFRSVASSMSSSGTEIQSVNEQLHAQQQGLTDSIASYIEQEEAASKKTEELGTKTEELDTKTAHAGHTVSGMVSTILEYSLAFQALSAVESSVIGFFTSAISNAMDDADAMAQLKVDLDNAGLSYKTLGPQIEGVAQQHVALGFEVSETEASMGKLLLTTGNYSDSLKLNELAMDLARAKHIDLASATKLVEEVMAGNTRSLKEYGISLDSASTSAEALTELQSQVAGSAESAANTTAGKWREVQTQWHELEGEIGTRMMPTLVKLFDEFEQDLPAIETLLEALIPPIQVIEAAFDAVAWSVKQVNNAIQELGAGMDSGGKTMEEVNSTLQLASANADLTAQEMKLVDAYNSVHKEHITINDLLTKEGQSTAISKDANKDLAAQVAKTGAGFDDITNRIQKADNAALKHSDAIAKLGTEYDKMAQQGQTDLADLADAFVTKMESINKSIADTQQKITDLGSSYAQSTASETESVADKIVASENKIADIKSKMGRATTASEAANLMDQLNAEQLNYQSSLTFRQTHQAQIDAAEARAKETDLQRTIDDYTAKQTLEAQDYLKKLATLRQEMKDKQDEATQEEELYNKKVAAINKVLDTGNAYFAKLSAERVATTTKEVDAEIAQFQRLAASIGSIKSSNATSLPSVSALPHFADGGIVTGPTIGLIGEAGPEAIIPLSQMGSMGGQNIQVNITGNTISSQMDLRNIAQAVSQEIVRVLRVNQKVSV